MTAIRSASERVMIAGVGAVSAAGIAAAALWDAMRDGRSSIAPLRHPDASRLRVRVAAQVPNGYERALNLSDEQRALMD